MEFLIVLGLIIVFLLYYISAKLKKPDEDKPLPYVLNKSILTDAELTFYKALVPHIYDTNIILAKVSLKDIFHIGKGVGKEYMVYFNKISRKHVDFLICDKHTLAPLYAIELDDSSHMKKSRQDRDIFVDGLYAHAGLKLIHIKTKYEYTTQDFSALL